MKTIYNKSVFLILMIWINIIQNTGCKKFVEAELPTDKLTAKAVFSSPSEASAALSNIYYLLVSNGLAGGEGSTSIINGLTADEMILLNPNFLTLHPFYNNTLSSKDVINNWPKYYDLIFRINSIIEGVETSIGIPQNAKNELIGQSKFLRAFVYFYLVNLYGGVPILTSTDYKLNMLLPRSTENEVYNQILKDLVEAQNLVSENYLKLDLLTATTERVTANKAVVTAFLARIYLYVGQWEKAEEEATKIIDNPKYGIPESLNEVFLMNSKEAIWQIEGDISKGDNSLDGNFFIPEPPGNVLNIRLSDNLLKEITIDDERRKDWLNTIEIGNSTFYYPFKYKKRNVSNGVTVEYNMILRLAEQYLIRAEARAHMNNTNGAISDLNVIRKRAKVDLYASLDQETLLRAIEKERQVELFSEWGHRWFDLKRTGRADAVLGPIKGSNWQPTDKLFPIPANEFNLNPSLRGHQNPGYTEE